MRISPAWRLCVLLFGVAYAMATEGGRVSLREYAAVRGNTIYLSDLLSPEAGVDLRAAAATIKLGRAPELGSLRVLEGMKLSQHLKAHPGLSRQLILPPSITIGRAGWPVDGQQAWDAITAYLTQHGLAAEEIPSAVTLTGLTGILSANEHPRVEVRSMRLDSLRQLWEFRLHCVAGNECGSFLVTMPVPVKFSQMLLAKSPGKSLGKVHANGSVPQHPAGAVLIKAGQPATLLMESGGMRIAMQVISLARGALGQQIRARDPETHRVFLAEVTGPAQLRATF